MRGHALSLVVLILFVTATGTAVATDNTPPLPAAGVDQTVTPGTTVYLDASGSTDPDGEITGVEWTIDTPGGTNQTPDCATCTQTQFEATTVGQYTVTLSVTDDDGATRADTLYVTVEEEDATSVSLSGPTSVAPGSSATFTASADSANVSLQSVSWVVDGDVVSQTAVSGDTASSTLTQSFGSGDNATVRVVVYDTLGYRGTANRTVRLDGGGGGGGPSRCDRGDAWEGLCNGGADPVVTIDGQTQIWNTNGQEGFQTLNEEGEVVSYTDLTASEFISVEEGNGDSLVVEEGVDVQTALNDAGSSEVIGGGSGASEKDSTDPSGGSGAPDNFFFPSTSTGSDIGGGGGGGGKGGGGGGGKGGGGGGKGR